MKNSCATYLSVFFIVWISITGCKRDGLEKQQGKADVRIRVIGSSFDGSGTLATRSSGSDQAIHPSIRIQEQRLQIGQDLFLELKLFPVDDAEPQKMSASDRKKAATEQGNLSDDVRYKVVVYTANENYVTERDYIRGRESDTEPLMLDGGQPYIFIVYSINSRSELPPVTFSDLSNKTLSTSSLSDIDGHADMMYFRRDMQVEGGQENHLEVVLRHSFSQITAKVDATATGYAIQAIDAGVDSHYPSATINLADAFITRSGSTETASIDFSGLNSAVVNGVPLILNGHTNAASFIISSLKVGPVTANDLTLHDLTIEPGVKYNLNLTLTPSDIYLEHAGQSAARIDGIIWMRHNLGANTDLDPDQNPSVQALHGNYYQWGEIRVVANASTPAGPISNWDHANPPNNAWNSGSESAPIKTSNDPCPSGYRIPTLNEFKKLIAATTQSDLGTWGNSSTNYRAAKVLKSNRNANVQLTFPIAGSRNWDNGTLENRGNVGFYWSSLIVNNRVRHTNFRFSINDNADDSSADRDWGFPLRCVSTQQ
ncbi:FISUMP domain-containing protein [Sphingobacterium suaedae]|uniref:FISUMP domain-containing protein n=1 Tax=Sphingobacterium suaedae TaxID=1686402 RepID=A0ABW5KLC1_9SPHI